ncbi:Sorbosone dehydrogenase-domain-containing protein [Tribonema minus]|uniref:Sorbosone dehydrogenase-domain-containing protein n=1 Tax=Tribonema minus TaxID=303371 RepID=A0A835ZHD3_9STRA|nr:Sorbosone dehydrogenase-domain-containing protein [Tribonema minus]
MTTAVFAHPLCLDDTFPVKGGSSFCTDSTSETYGSCCHSAQALQQRLFLYDHHTLSAACAPYQAKVACAACNPFASHAYAAGVNGEVGYCKGFCNKYVKACAKDMQLPEDFCALHSSDSMYCYPYVESDATPSTTLEPFFKNLTLPSKLVGAFMRPDLRVWWFLDQSGKIFEVPHDPLATSMRLVLDITSRVNQGGGELGLLGLAFSPDFSTTKRFYINYVDNEMETVIARHVHNGHMRGTGNVEARLLQFHQPSENHNGGTLLFKPSDIEHPEGKDHYDLYISTGDGGGDDDPHRNGQSLTTNLGKILRLRISSDVSESGFSIPADNMRSNDGKLTLIYALGMRNPWKCTFDATTDLLYCGDVGQEAVEEFDIIYIGQNYGWSNYEGTHLLNGPDAILYNPVYEYCHSDTAACASVVGECIIGGYVYRGSLHSDTYGVSYIFADYMQESILRAFKEPGTGAWNAEPLVATTGWSISSLAEDRDRELYVIQYGVGANMYALPAKAT